MSRSPNPAFFKKVEEDMVFEAFDIALKPVLETIRATTDPTLKADLIYRTINACLDLQDPGPIPAGETPIEAAKDREAQLSWPSGGQPPRWPWPIKQ